MAEAIVDSPASSTRIRQSAVAPGISRVEAMEEVTDPAG